MNPTIDLLMAHRSIRKFTDEPIGDALLETLVAAGQAAASSSFLQGVTIMRVTDPSKRQQFVELANNQSYIAAAPEFLVFCADLSRPNRCCEMHGGTPTATWALLGSQLLVRMVKANPHLTSSRGVPGCWNMMETKLPPDRRTSSA